MTSRPVTEVTSLLRAWSRSDRSAEQKLWPILYAELKLLVQREMRREQRAHALRTGTQVNELYLRLTDWDAAQWQNHESQGWASHR